jgi:hypothetical protein
MVQRVNLPPGCEGLNMQDGTRYSGKSGGTVTVEDRHAAAVTKLSTGGDGGLVDGRFKGFLGTKKGRWCGPCRRVWNAWSHSCPRCGGITESEDETLAGPDADREGGGRSVYLVPDTGQGLV